VAWTSSYSPSFAQPLLNTSSDTRKAVLGTDATNLPLDHCTSWECGNLEISYLPTSRAFGFARAARIPTSRRLYVPGIAKADLPRALSRVPAGETILLLAHKPDYADFVAKFSVDLQLSGNSHGGQVRVPGVGLIVLPKLARKYHTGLYQIHELQVYTSRGVGVISPPVRFNCPRRSV